MARWTLALLFITQLACEPPAADDSSARESDRAAPAQPRDTTGSAAPGADNNPRLTVDAEGLRFFLVPSGTARPVPFGTPEEQVIALLRRTRGAPIERGENVDCGATRVAWADGLETWFARERFVGWSLGPAATVRTASGIGIGSTREELLAAYDARITPSSLGTEFDAGFAGTLDSTDPGARIDHMWAGIVCLAR